MELAFMSPMSQRAVALMALLSGLVAEPPEVSAHPHVWVSMQTEIIYTNDGLVSEVRHHWTFDEMYSTFAVQGLDTRKKGEFSREDLAPLAQVNVESLHEYEYFTVGRIGSKRVAFGKPVNYWLDFKDYVLTLHFTLPLTPPVKAQSLSLEIYDPLAFVDFTLDKRNAVTLVGAPPACKLTLHKPENSLSNTRLSEAFFNALSASNRWGETYANKIRIRC
jgi:ABC-type uncharacterized transport system substrate-binding protein